MITLGMRFKSNGGQGPGVGYIVAIKGDRAVLKYRSGATATRWRRTRLSIALLEAHQYGWRRRAPHLKAIPKAQP